MATIRVRDWTKEQIEKIRDAESHSSHDSVIKGLLKDRELAKFAGMPAEELNEHAEPERTTDIDKPFDDLTVLAELQNADNGVVFFWCPNCGNEIAHVGFDEQNSLSIFEMECQRCLARLDQRAIVSIEVGYPIEERIVEETVNDDLKRCVIDYWDRSLEAVPAGSLEDDDIDEERLVWQYNEYLQEFGWDWPTDVPVIGLQPGETYRNEATGDRIEVIESETTNRGGVDDYRIQRYAEDDAEGQSDVLDASSLMKLILSRSLYAPGADSEATTLDSSASAE